MLLAKKDCIGVITIDKAHKFFDSLPSYHPAFNDRKEISYRSMSATLTKDQIVLLQQDELQQYCHFEDGCMKQGGQIHR